MASRIVFLHGTGLLGASIGLSLRARDWTVLGWDPDPTALEEAFRRGAIETKLDSPSTDGCDLLVLAGPPEAIVAALGKMSTEALVTDIASVKVPVVAAAGSLPRFVGGHPMAGGETSGAGLASSSLFHGANWVLTTDGADLGDIDFLESVVRSLGANPVLMTADEHDAAVARVSHLPHVLAAALVHLAATDPHTLELAGGGFRDLTRVAAASSDWWTEVLTANAAEVEASIAEAEALLDSWKRALSKGDAGAVRGHLDEARSVRSRLGEHNTQVRVILLDRPGEIARVGHALEASRVDVRDFQLRHGEHGGGGILTISIRPGGREMLTRALVEEGFELQVEDAPSRSG